MAEFVAVRCPACGREASDPAFSKFGLSFRACRDCHTIYMNPRPSETLMADYYANSENYAYWAKHIFPASEASRRENIHTPWHARILELCRRHDVATGTLVEVGPGFGTFCRVALDQGAFSRVVAVEPTPELAAACRARGIEVIERRVEDAESALTGADVVVAFEVIEHLFEPKRFCAGAARLLRPGGLLVLTCPNGLGFDVATLGAESLAVDSEHVNLFNPASLERLVRGAGFEPLESATPGRLDAEFVRTAALDGRLDLSNQPLLRRVLIEEWDTLGWPFQQFLAANGLSSHMWLAARRSAA